MAHERSVSPTVDPSKLRRRGTPSRAGSSDSAVARDEQALLHRKLRDLRSKNSGAAYGRTVSDDSVSYNGPGLKGGSSRSLQARDEYNRTGSSRSIKTQESATSSAGSLTGSSVEFAIQHTVDAMALGRASTHSIATHESSTLSFAVDDSMTIDTTTQTPAAAAAAAVVSSPIPAPAAASPRPRPSHNRGLSRRGRLSSQSNLNVSTRGSFTDNPSDHGGPSTPLSTASVVALERLQQRRDRNEKARARGLGARKVSQTRLVEPGVVPVVSAGGAMSPLVPSSNSNRTPTRLASKGATINSLVSTAEGKGNLPLALQQVPLDGLLDDSDNLDYDAGEIIVAEERLTPPTAALGSAHSNNSSARCLTRMGSVSGTRLGLRGRRQSSRQILQDSSHHSSVATPLSPQQLPMSPQQQQQQLLDAATAPTTLGSPLEQQMQQPLYQPTQRDWAVLYNKHVQELERKDLEIAMKLSTKEGAPDNTAHGDEEEDDEGNSLDGIELALEASRRDMNQASEEDEMLEMVLQMSKNDELDTSFANASFTDGGLPRSPERSRPHQESVSALDCHEPCRNGSEEDVTNDDLLPAMPSRNSDADEELQRVLRMSSVQQLQPESAPLSEEEELARVMKLSERETSNAQDKGDKEEEEFMRALMLSQQQHEDEQMKREKAAAGKHDNEDDELMRVLALSQQEASDHEKEREMMELVLRLSRQETADGPCW